MTGLIAPGAEFLEAKRAAELDAQLFTEGMEFLNAKYGTQSTNMAAILEHIDDAGIAADIDTLGRRQPASSLSNISMLTGLVTCASNPASLERC